MDVETVPTRTSGGVSTSISGRRCFVTRAQQEWQQDDPDSAEGFHVFSRAECLVTGRGIEAAGASRLRPLRMPASSKPAGANLRSNRTRAATTPAVYRSFG